MCIKQTQFICEGKGIQGLILDIVALMCYYMPAQFPTACPLNRLKPINYYIFINPDMTYGLKKYIFRQIFDEYLKIKIIDFEVSKSNIFKTFLLLKEV